MYRILVKDLYFGYRSNSQVLKGVSFSISECGIYLLIGRNGSGKTTLFKILIKYLPFNRGIVRIEGKDLNSINNKTLAKNVAFLESSLPLIPLTVREIISWGFYPYDGKGDMYTVANKLELTPFLDKKFTELSTGEKKRVLLGRIFAQRAGIVLIDEPFNFLDPKYTVETVLLLKELAKERVVLISTHNLNVARLIGDYVFFLKDGKIISNKNRNKLFSGDDIYSVFDIKNNLKHYFKELYGIK